MLGKLIKHEFKATGRVIPFLYLGIAAMGLVGYIGLKLNSEAVGVLSCAVMFLGSIGVYIATLALIAMQFYKSMFSNQGYLTMTLPVSTGKILFSKSLVAFLWILASAAVMIASIFSAVMMMFDHSGDINEFFEALKHIPSGWVLLAVTMLCTLLIGTLYLVAMIVFSTTFANTGFFNKSGAGASVLAFIITYFCTNILEQLFTVIIPISLVVEDNSIYFSTENMVGFMIQSINSDVATSVPVGMGGILFEIAAAAAMLIAANYLLKRKVCLK